MGTGVRTTTGVNRILAAALQPKSRLQMEDVPRRGLFPAAHELFEIHEWTVE